MTRLHPWYRWVIPLILMIALIVMLALARPAPVVAAPYDGMLALARAADVAWDADYPGHFTLPLPYPDARHANLPRLAADIAAQIAEEGLGLDGRMPDSVTWADYGSDRNSIAGRWAWSNDVTLNDRYRDDPAWWNRPWFGVLIHEMVHAQGVYDETRTEILTWEVEAAMAQLGYPGARYDLLRTLRTDALGAAWWMAAYERPVLLSDADVRRYPCCPLPTGDTSAVDAVRHELLDPTEWRRIEKNMRWWLHESGRDYESVIDTYVARVLGQLVPAACSPDPVIADASVAAVVAGGMPMTLPIKLPEFHADDFQAVLSEIGYCGGLL